MNTKNAFSAVQNKSKRTVAETANNAINAIPAADNLKVANDLIRKNCGTPIPQANKLLPNLPPHSNAAAKPFTAISKKLNPKLNLPRHNAATSSWTPPTSNAASASWF